MAESTIPSLVVRQARRTPDHVAVVDARVRLTYRDLAQRVADLADRLSAAGVGPESVVGVGMPRSAEMVVSVLAITAAGGAFVPVDPTWPVARRERVLADSGAVAVVADADTVEWPVPVLHLDILDEPRDLGDPIDRLAALSLSDPRPGDGLRLAYVIFTSGSTGAPKGAMIRHEAICERLVWQRDEILHFGSGDATLFKAPLSFDISVNEILLPLVSGGRVVVAAAGDERDPDRLLEIIETERVTFVYLVSSMLDVLLEMDRVRARTGPSALGSLRHVWCGGEVLTPGLFARFRAQTDTTLYHGYGPAEATIGVSHVIYRESAERIATSIGRPNPRTSLYVLDERLTPLGVGEAGELYASGFLLGRGYVNAPGLTASRFVADPFDGDGARMYRTGDRARWTADGSLEFLGRVDNQVKLRGRRIELEEIEAAVASADGVRHCAVTVAEIGATQRLVAYVTAASDVPAGWSADDAVRRSCALTLPDYMIPEIVVTLETMPTTANGKVDRRALPVPAPVSHGGDAVPSTPGETLLCRVFADVLGVDSVAADDDFFALGGDSIVAIRVISALRGEGWTVRVRDLLAARTPIDLAPRLTRAEDSAVADVPAWGPTPATPILQWMHDVAAPSGLDAFHQGICLTTPVGLDRATLQSAVDAVVDRHPILSAALASAVELTVPPAGRRVDVAIAEPTDEPADLARDAAARLDHRSGVVLAVTWIDRPGDTGRLVVIAHHAVVDGISLRVIADDLASAVVDPAALTAEPVSWRAWAQSLADAARSGAFDDERDFWREACAAAPGVLGVEPLDARDTVATEAHHTVDLDVDLTRGLVDVLPAAIHGSPNDALVAALAVAVTEHLGSAAVTVEMEGHGRESQAVGDVDLSRTVGWFTTLYPVRIDLSGMERDDPSSLVKGVKEQLRRIPRNGIGYGALRHLSDDPVPAHRAPVLFNYLGRFARTDGNWAMAPGTIPYEGRDPRMPLPRPLEVNAVVADGVDGPRMSVTFSRASRVLTDADVRSIADRWVDVLRRIVGAEVRGHTASDFPTVRLSDADVAALEAGHPGLLDVSAPTPAQLGILFHAADSAHDPYLVQQIIELDGPVDVDAFAEAAHETVRRHAALSARFVQVSDGSTVVVTGDAPAPDVRAVDVADGSDVDAAVRRAAADDRARGFDLARAPLTRYTIVRADASRSRLIQTVHHAIADGWSVPLVLGTLRRAYIGERRTGGDRHRAAIAALHARDRADERAAWGRYLDGVDEATSLAAMFDAATLVDDAARDSGMPGVGVRTHRIDSAAVADYARRHGVTVGSVVHAAWGSTLALLTGRTDVTFGSVVSGRGPGLDACVGLLVNTVPVRFHFAPDRRVVDAVIDHAADALTVVDHPHMPLADVHRSAGVRTLFDTLVVIENLPTQADDDVDAPFRFGAIEVIEAPHYPLTVMVALHDEIVVTVTNRRADLGDGPADRAAALFVDLLSTIVSADDGDLGAALLGVGAAPDTGGSTADHPSTIAARVDAALPTLPEVVFADTVTPGVDVAAHAVRLRDELRAVGVGPEARVAVRCDRGVDLLCTSLAVIAVGATLVPVDPAYPADRIAHMLDASEPVMVLDSGVVPDRPAAAATGNARPENGAYLLFTSGSTGVPKAVLGTQRAVAARLAWQHPVGTARRGARLMKSSLSFVDGLTELLAAALTAERIVIADETQMRDLTALAALIARWDVDEVTTIPSAATALRRSCAEQVSAVRRWTLSAEPLTADAVDLLADADTVVDNFYGSSEVTGDVTAGRATPGAPVTVGRPVPGSAVRVLDRWLRPVEDGVIGELYAAGPQLARGYHGAHAVTASRFVADPFGEPGSRLYRTGDLAARVGGEIVLHGRVDVQFSVRGMRVEAGEVEAALLDRSDVAAAVVHAVGSPARLIGYVVAAPGADVDPREVVARLGGRLPRHAVPDQIVVLDALPTTPSGKVDRAALPDPAAASAPSRAPETAAERALVGIVRDVLGRPDVGPDDDFFALGGDSISSVAVAARAQRAGLAVSTQDVFRLRTAAALAANGLPAATPTPVAPTPVLHQIRTSGIDPADLVYTEVASLGTMTVDDVRAGLVRLAATVDAASMRVTPRNRLIWTAETGGDVAPIPLVVVDRPEGAAALAREHVDIAAGRAVAAVVVTSGGRSDLLLAAHALAMDRASLHAAITAVITSTSLESASVGAVADAVDDASRHHDFGRFAAAGGRAEPTRLEQALADAADAVLGAALLIDVETDLRALPGVADDAAGPFTPTVPFEHAGPADTRHWHPVAQVHDPTVRKAMRRRPAAGLLLTRVYGPPGEPDRLEGAERRYSIAARYRLNDDGTHDVAVVGDDRGVTRELARAWRRVLDATTTDTKDRQ
ncbi:hypothetical protein nbrc107696_35830 [Gordonia spumicola]|uniref:Carrier domain-containing protein n=1 Tax=Gordonia spumicola TaxID=589161 RepID=A0A7I9VCV5_9ACTN|nr:hypothetical protein nbrc107696_35830 [Gordonia spumicola]